MRDDEDDLFVDDDEQYPDEEDWDDASPDEDDDLDGTVPCPNCGRDIHELADSCPSCGEFLVDHRESASSTPNWTNGKPGWFIVLGILGVIAAIYALLRSN